MADQYHDEEYEPVDEGVLKDFDARERRVGQKKTGLIIAIGLVLGLVVAWFMAADEPTPLAKEKAVAERASEVTPLESLPEPVKAEPVAKGEEIDSLIAQLDNQNQIAEDDTTGPVEQRRLPDAPVEEKHAEEPAPAAVSPDEPVVPSPAVVATPSAPKPTPPVSTGGYAVQMLATTNADQGFSERDRLIKRGFAAWISMGKVKKSFFRVEAKQFASIKKAAPLSALLAASGYRNKVVKIAGGARVTLDLGRYNKRMAAMRFADKVASDGFIASVNKRDEPVSLYLVRVGRYATGKEAGEVEKSLRAKGYSPLGVVGPIYK